MSDKQALRTLMRHRKQAMPPEQLRTLSQQLMEQLQQHPRFRAARTVLLFHSLPDEPCTHALLDAWKDRKELWLPVVCGSELRTGRYTRREELAQGAFRISEPATTPEEQAEPIDLVVVPGVAFDAEGHRLGRGRGYYDKFLATLTPRPYLLGLCFPFQLLEAVPIDAHDVTMDEVLSL